MTRRDTGRLERRTSTAGLDLAVKKLITIIRELNAIMKTALRITDPALLAAWKNASRVYSDPVRTPDEETTPVAPAVALASSGDKAAPADSIVSHGATEVLEPAKPRLNGNGSASSALIA